MIRLRESGAMPPAPTWREDSMGPRCCRTARFW
jgi:hypothetical protein